MLQYKERYIEIYTNNSAPSQPRRTGKSAIRKVGILIRELSDDDDDDDANDDPVEPSDSTAPWRDDFNGYLYSKDQLGDMTIVEWWGVHISSPLLHD
jgi:hypothetical protein